MNKRAQRRREENGSNSTEEQDFPFTYDLILALRLCVLLLKLPFQTVTWSATGLGRIELMLQKADSTTVAVVN